MCSGSGVQYIDMCKGLYNRIPYFKQLIDTGFQQLKEITGIDFSKIVYPDTITEDFLHTINQNEYTQPLVFKKTNRCLRGRKIAHGFLLYAAICN